MRPPRVFRLSSVRPTPQGKGAHACTRARRSRERRYARHPPRISNVIRSRASASSFLALPRRMRTAGDAPGLVTRGRDLRVRPLRAREARGDDVQPSPRARPRLPDHPAPPRPRARTRKRPAESVTNRLPFSLHPRDAGNDRKRDRRARRGCAVVTSISVRDGGRGGAGYRGAEPPGQGQGRLRAEGRGAWTTRAFREAFFSNVCVCGFSRLECIRYQPGTRKRRIRVFSFSATREKNLRRLFLTADARRRVDSSGSERNRLLIVDFLHAAFDTRADIG